MMLFSFEVDVLEISLREQIDFVDKIFIVEATTTTKGVLFIINSILLCDKNVLLLHTQLNKTLPKFINGCMTHVLSPNLPFFIYSLHP